MNSEKRRSDTLENSIGLLFWPSASMPDACVSGCPSHRSRYRYVIYFINNYLQGALMTQPNNNSAYLACCLFHKKWRPTWYGYARAWSSCYNTINTGELLLPVHRFVQTKSIFQFRMQNPYRPFPLYLVASTRLPYSLETYRRKWTVLEFTHTVSSLMTVPPPM